jgi:hypothetical protein
VADFVEYRIDIHHNIQGAICSIRTLFIGELRHWIVATKTSIAESDPDTLAFSSRFPPGSSIQVRVDPSHASRSVAED